MQAVWQRTPWKRGRQALMAALLLAQLSDQPLVQVLHQKMLDSARYWRSWLNSFLSI